MPDNERPLAGALDAPGGGKAEMPPEPAPLAGIARRLYNECPDAEPAFIQSLGLAVQEEWARLARPARRTGRLWLWAARVGAAALVMALLLAFSTQAPGQAALSRVISIFRHATVEQIPRLASTPAAFPQVETYAELEQAQAAAGFPIRVPSYLPQGLALNSVEVIEDQGLHRVLLSYSNDLGEAGQGTGAVLIQEFLSSDSPEAQPLALQVGPDSTERLQVAGRPALWIQGYWGPNGRWVRGGQDAVLMVQDGDILIQVIGSLTQAECVRIAESMLQ